MFVLPKNDWSLNNTAAGTTRCFSKQAEIKTKFEVVFCLSFFMFYCLFVLHYRNISVADYLNVLLTTVKLSNKKNGPGLPPFPLLSQLCTFHSEILLF